MTLQEILASVNGFTGQPIYRPETGQVDLGLTEKLQQIVSPDKAYASTGGSDLIGGDNTTGKVLSAIPQTAGVGAYVTNTTNKAQDNYNNMVSGAEQANSGGGGGSELDELKAIEQAGNLNPAQKTRLEELTAGDNNGGGDGGFAALVARARGAYDEAVRRAQYGLSRARGLYDEGKGVLDKRRGEFKETYDTGNNDILTSYEGERGNLQASNAGAQKRAANALRAMGITGGSGAINYQGRIRQEQAKQQGNLATEKTGNERANLGAFNERNQWADTQEGALLRSLRDAEEAARATEAQAGLVQQGDVDSINRASENYFNNILANQQALAAAKGGISSFSAPSYAVDMNNFAGAIGNNLPAVGTVGGTNTAVNGGVSLEEMDPTLALLKKRAGVAGAGLYA